MDFFRRISSATSHPPHSRRLTCQWITPFNLKRERHAVPLVPSPQSTYTRRMYFLGLGRRIFNSRWLISVTNETGAAVRPLLRAPLASNDDPPLGSCLSKLILLCDAFSRRPVKSRCWCRIRNCRLNHANAPYCTCLRVKSHKVCELKEFHDGKEKVEGTCCSDLCILVPS